MQGLLKFTRSEDLQPQTLSLAALVDEVVGVIRPECEAAGVTVVVEGVDRLPPITGDPTMLRQALLNLALNARQAMPNGGTLRISATARGQARRHQRRRHRRRDQAGAPRPDLRPLLHDAREGQRHRAVDGLSDRAAARRRDRSAVHRGARHDVPNLAAARPCVDGGRDPCHNGRYCATPASRRGAAWPWLPADARPRARRRRWRRPPLDVPAPPPRIIVPPAPRARRRLPRPSQGPRRSRRRRRAARRLRGRRRRPRRPSPQTRRPWRPWRPGARAGRDASTDAARHGEAKRNARCASC